MKIEWLNAEMTEARVTRGLLWWKRVAIVQRKESGAEVSTWTEYGPRTNKVNWMHVTAAAWCDVDLDVRLNVRRKRDLTWKRPTPLAQARVVR